MTTRFKQLNVDWNADPNGEDARVTVVGSAVELSVYANAYMYPLFQEGQRIRLVFDGATRYRLGPTNDEGWYRGQCRFSGVIPWGEFYEISGDLRLDRCPNDWHVAGSQGDAETQHFLFYMKDQTFECDAASWQLHR